MQNGLFYALERWKKQVKQQRRRRRSGFYIHVDLLKQRSRPRQNVHLALVHTRPSSESLELSCPKTHHQSGSGIWLHDTAVNYTSVFKPPHKGLHQRGSKSAVRWWKIQQICKENQLHRRQYQDFTVKIWPWNEILSKIDTWSDASLSNIFMWEI